MNTYEIHLFSGQPELVTASYFGLDRGCLVFTRNTAYEDVDVAAYAPGVWKLVVKQEPK